MQHTPLGAGYPPEMGYILRRSSVDSKEGMIISPQDGSGQTVFFSFDDLDRVLVPSHFAPNATSVEVDSDSSSSGGLYGSPPSAPARSRSSATIRHSAGSSPRSTNSPYARPDGSPESARHSDDDFSSRLHRVRSESLKSSIDYGDALAPELSQRNFGSRQAPQTVPAADSVRTEVGSEPLDIFWMPSLGRAVSPATAATSHGGGEQPVTIHFAAGSWFQTFDSEGEIVPWMNPNGWIKGQLKESQHCVCGFQWFKNGRQLAKQKDCLDVTADEIPAIFKRPAVCREHIAICRKRGEDDPLVALCRWTRDADRRKTGAVKPKHSRSN